MEDVDTSRCIAGADQTILAQLAACGLISDEPPVYQSQRGALYQRALDQLVAAGWAYPCSCTRQDIERALTALGQPKLRHQELVYPGTCRQGLNGRAARAWRFSTKKCEDNWALAQTNREQSAINSVANDAPTLVATDQTLVWHDRWLSAQAQHVSREVGDFVLKRADGFWAYQLAVVADDAAQRVTDIVRGQDLADNTARQILLQRALGFAMPRYLHTPLVLGANGEKLSKQNGAKALDLSQPLQALNRAAAVLRLTPQTGTVSLALTAWIDEWKDSWGNTRRATSPPPVAPG